jgi:signal transduction histidine kinase
MESRRVLVVEDEETIGLVIRQTLESHDCEVSVARSAEEALGLLRERTFDAALLDIILPGAGGLDLLKRMNEGWPDITVLMMTSHSSLETAVQAIRQGAYDYLRKPFDDVEDIWVGVSRALERAQLTQKNRAFLRLVTAQNQELADSVRRLMSLIQASRAMGDVQSLPELFEFFVDLVCGELDVDRISLMLLDPTGEFLTIASHRGLDDIDITRVQVPVGEGIAGRVARDARPFLVQDVKADPRMQGAGMADLANSFICAPLVLSVPIVSHAKTLGVLNVTNRRSGQPFTPEDLEYVQGMASQIAVTVESARRFEDLQHAYESLRNAQQQLVVAARLQAVGQMAAGVAHDFNNALAVILGRTETCLLRLDAGGEIDRDAMRNNLETIAKVALQGAGAVRRVQDFTRIRKDAPRGRVDINQVIRDSVEMTRPKWRGEAGARGKEIQIELSLDDIPPVRGNSHEISQVVSNLIFNAVEAMPEGGQLSFHTSLAGDRVVVEVVDTGVGMDEEAKRRVFEPFFTTKPTGNGLGMSIVYGIVLRHEGTIDVESAPGRGARFCLAFPVVTGSGDDVIEDPEPDTVPRHARILFVDDDEIVRQTIQYALEDGGHQVVAVSSGPQAIDAFDPAQFDVAITDFNMPIMSGVELACRLRERDGDLPIILLSGWANLEEEEAIRRAGIGFVLSKPCQAETLHRTVRRALMSRGAATSAVPGVSAETCTGVLPKGGKQ